jgi:hypothetical protein
MEKKTQEVLSIVKENMKAGKDIKAGINPARWHKLLEKYSSVFIKNKISLDICIPMQYCIIVVAFGCTRG